MALVVTALAHSPARGDDPAGAVAKALEAPARIG